LLHPPDVWSLRETLGSSLPPCRRVGWPCGRGPRGSTSGTKDSPASPFRRRPRLILLFRTEKHAGNPL